MAPVPVLAVAVAALLGATPGAARAEPVSVRLELQARPECATRDQLTARVLARSSRIRFDDTAAALVRATLAPAAGRAVAGELTVVQADGKEFVRRILAPSCEQASDGLALVIVLALDPEALATLPPPPPSPPAAPRPPPPPPAPPPPPTPLPPAHTGWGIEAGGRVVQGLAPRVMPAIAVTARVTRERGALWSPALVLSFLHAVSGDLNEPGGTADFTLDAATLDACPVRLAASIFEARPCASLLVGRLGASGSNTYSPASAQRTFAASGAALLLGAALAAHLDVAVRLEAEASWIRDRFAFTPTDFHRTAAITLSAGLALGLRFR